MVESGSESEHERKSDPEVTLGMPALLGIFFGLVILCGVFFGFGYSMGHRSAAPTGGPHTTSSAQPPVTQTGANTTADDSSPDYTKPSPNSNEPAPALTVARPTRTAAEPSQPSAASLTDTPANPTTTHSQRYVSPSAATPAAYSTAIPAGAFMVQIAAVSRPEDGEALIAALRKRGYNVSARSEPQDKLLHVQTGPFATRAEANAMRQKLLSDGYNAIIK